MFIVALPASYNAILRGHSANVLGLAFGTQSSVLASAGRDGTVRIWNMKDGKEIARIEKGNVVLSFVVFTKEGTSLAVGDWDGRLSLWNRGQHSQIWQTTIGNDRIESLAISPDGSFLLSGGPSVVGNAGNHNRQEASRWGTLISYFGVS